MKRNMLLLALCLAVAACSDDDPVVDRRAAPELPLEPLAAGRISRDIILDFQMLESHMTGPWIDPTTRLFFSAEDWEATMAALGEEGGLSVMPPPGVPQGVNWRTECVLLCTLGQQNSGPSDMSIMRITRRGRDVTVAVSISPPGPHAFPTAPYEIVKFRRKGIERVALEIIDFREARDRAHVERENVTP